MNHTLQKPEDLSLTKPYTTAYDDIL